MPACCEKPMPTPPPWCSDTQVAPEAQFSSALSSGQSETASEPSRIASVSRLGEATEPESRWSRPMTIGAFSSPRATISLKARPSRWRSPRPTQQMRAGRPWKWMRSRAMSSQVMQMRVVRHQLLHLGVGPVDVLGVARQRRPAERADAAAEQRADIGGHEAGEVEGVGHALLLAPSGGCCCRSRRSARPRVEVEHRPHMLGHRCACAAALDRLRVAARAAPPIAASVQPCGR